MVPNPLDAGSWSQLAAIQGLVPDIYSPDTTRSDTLVAIAIAGQTIVALAIALRLYTRLVITRMFGLDDWLIMAAVFVNVAVTADNIICAHAGAGKHIGTLSSTLELFSKSSWIGSILNGIAQTFMKASILVFYLKLFPGKTVRLGSYILLVVNVGYGIAGALALIFQCLPVGANDFTPGIVPKCINISAFFYINGWMLLVVDILTFLLPLPSLLQLNMPLAQRISVALIFAVGIIPCVATVFRIMYSYATLHTNDVTYILGGAFIWGVIEIDLAIICACAASFKPLVRKFFPAWLGGSSSGTSDQGNHTISPARQQPYALRTFSITDENPVGKHGIASKGFARDVEIGAITHPDYEGGVFNVEITKSTEVMVVDNDKFPIEHERAWRQYGQNK